MILKPKKKLKFQNRFKNKNKPKSLGSGGKKMGKLEKKKMKKIR